jgi:hypothetical protein
MLQRVFNILHVKSVILRWAFNILDVRSLVFQCVFNIFDIRSVISRRVLNIFDQKVIILYGVFVKSPYVRRVCEGHFSENMCISIGGTPPNQAHNLGRLNSTLLYVSQNPEC